MSTVSSFFFTAGCILRALCEFARYALGFGWALLAPKALLAARVLGAESQLAVDLNACRKRRKRRRQFTPAFRLLWVALSEVLEGWAELAHLMKPERSAKTLPLDVERHVFADTQITAYRLAA